MPENISTKTAAEAPTVNDVIHRLRGELTPRCGRGEAEAIIRLIFQYLKDWSPVDMIINENKPLSEYMQEKIAEIERRLLDNEPIQYITGIAYFYGMDFHVEPGALIPRPETEELVDIVVANNKCRDLSVLDVGTGTGCIAVALSRNLPFSHITAVDNSPKALEIARGNARELHAESNIDFVEADIFKWRPADDAYDIIVSNPPYVDESEKAAMEPNVLRYEPAEAIFVPDSDPLLYYRRIATLGLDALRSGGSIYFEINPRHGDQLCDLMKDLGYKDVKTTLDINGKRRFLGARKN